MLEESKINWLFVDVDGVMTNGKKGYDNHHQVMFKEYNDKDFTALSLFKKKGVKVVLLSGDKQINEGMAKSRGLEIYFTKWLTVDGEINSEKVEKMKELGADLSKSAYIGDDYFDINIFKNVEYSFCPSDSPQYVKDNCKICLYTKGGDGVIAELYHYFYGDNFE